LRVLYFSRVQIVLFGVSLLGNDLESELLVAVGLFDSLND